MPESTKVENRFKELEDFAMTISRDRGKDKDRVPIASSSYSKIQSRSFPVSEGYDVETIREAIRTGSPQELQELSRHFNRYSGIYSRLLNYLSTLLLYRGLVIPKVNDSKFSSLSEAAHKKIYEQYLKACDYLAALSVPQNFSRVTHLVLLNGVYFGLLREKNGAATLQDLPVKYCRVLFKNTANLDILEFDLRYFDQQITDINMRERILLTYPEDVQRAYMEYRNNGPNSSIWIEIPPEIGGCVFYYKDLIPFFISSLPQIFAYDEAQDREAQRDINALVKLLIQEFPVDTKTGELVFDTEEMKSCHKSVSNMLRDNDLIDVITTPAKIHLESTAEGTSATDGKTRLAKYRDAAFDAAGTSQLLFNPNSSAALDISINKDVALMYDWSRMYSSWISYQLNLRFETSHVSFVYETLPISIHNLDKMVAMYRNMAQYGYPKLYGAAAAGIEQSTLTSLLAIENTIMNLNERMIPLRSSYTSSEKDGKEKESGSNTASAGDIDNSGGRPTLSPEERAEKTTANQESM